MPTEVKNQSECPCGSIQECDAEAGRIVNLLMEVAKVVVVRLNFKLPDEAKDHLRNHYHKQFFHALTVKCKVFKEAEPELRMLAAVLGGRLVHHAEQRQPEERKIERRDVALAILDVDCPPTADGKRVDWCN